MVKAAKTLWKTRVAPLAASEDGEAHTSETFERGQATGLAEEANSK